MKIPSLTIQQLLEAGVHLGHKTLRWNPKMKKYIFGKRDSIHIIDLTQTLELTNVALEKVYNTILNNGKILFVSTKKQASEAIAEVAKETDQYFVNYRWLGGMLTNWGTISASIKKLKKIDIDLSTENRGFTKKELLKIPIFGWYLKKIGSISVNRNKITKDNLGFIEKIKSSIQNSNRPILIFPQATRTAVDDKQPFKKGVSKIYEKLNFICVPVALNSGNVWPKSGKLNSNKTITISILKHIPVGLSNEDFLSKLEYELYSELESIR